jgi:hypothetical protein
MAGDAFKAKLARVEALRTITDDTALAAGLRKALSDRSNFVVAKAAAVAADRYATAVVPELLAAYDRFADAPANDPLVRAKVAIASALKELDVRDPAPFVRGLTYVQLEGTWGGVEDRAGPLRAACAHALVACEIDTVPLLTLLIERLVDNDARVRCEVVRAIAQAGGDESVLLLRLKALGGDTEPEVLGECFSALLDREPHASIAFVERFVADARVDVGVEAVSALAAARDPEALARIIALWSGEMPAELRRAIVFACGASRLAAAAEFLLAVVAESPGELAIAALRALSTSRFRDDVGARARAVAAASDDDGVAAAYQRAFGEA